MKMSEFLKTEQESLDNGEKPGYELEHVIIKYKDVQYVKFKNGKVF